MFNMCSIVLYDHFSSTKCQTKLGLDRQAGQIYIYNAYPNKVQYDSKTMLNINHKRTYKIVNRHSQ